MKQLTAIAAALALFAGPLLVKSASAHAVCHKGTYSCAERNEHHARTGIRWIKKHAPLYRKYRLYRKVLRAHVILFQSSARRAHALRYTVRPPHYREWMCIHGGVKYGAAWGTGEGSWSDPNEPYYGGLQMDWSFMSAYGGWLLRSKGTADHWTPFEQMWVGEKALDAGRGFYPWPNTARACGLI